MHRDCDEALHGPQFQSCYILLLFEEGPIFLCLVSSAFAVAFFYIIRLCCLLHPSSSQFILHRLQMALDRAVDIGVVIINSFVVVTLSLIPLTLLCRTEMGWFSTFLG